MPKKTDEKISEIINIVNKIFKGKNLNITIKGEGFSLLIQCEKTK